MNRTKIEYLDYTWNPIVGCQGIDCAVREHCWAKGQAKRRKGKCDDCYAFKPHYHYERFDQPLHVKKPNRIGVGFMGDIYDKAYGICANQSIFRVMEQASWHTFLCLTKQSQNMLIFNRNWQTFYHDNVWMGVSVNRKEDLHRIGDLKKTDAEVKYVSFEPLYDDLGTIIADDLEALDWAIIGLQTRPRDLPPMLAVANLIKQLEDHHVPIFLKNNLGALGWKGYKQLPKVVQK